MSEIAIYTMVMFWLGVFLTKAIFYFEYKSKKRKLQNSLVTSIAYTLNCTEAILRANAVILLEDHPNPNLSEPERMAFIKKQEEEISTAMSILTALALSSIDPKNRKQLPFTNWAELKIVLNKIQKVTETKKE